MKRLEILVVDDDRDFGESLAEALELVGHRAMLALSGEEAVSLFMENDFDITFMDVRLPGRSGVESFYEIRRMKPSARVVMMTGYSVPQLLEQAVDHGAWDILHKPLEMQNVLGMIEKIKPCGVLIADDDPDFLAGLKNVLENEGYSVHVARDGETVLEKLQFNQVDVLNLDLRLPIMGGLETYRRMKAARRCVPTIIVTTSGGKETETSPLLEAFSVYGILNKPFDTEALLHALEEICREGEEKETPAG